MGINTQMAKPLIPLSLKPVVVGVVSVITAVTTGVVAVAQQTSAVLVANSSRPFVEFRTFPNATAIVAAQGRPGDRVEVIDQFPGRDNFTWYFVRSPDSNAGGWVREDLLVLSSTRPPVTSPGTPAAPVPESALNACRNYAFVQLNTFRSDIAITGSRAETSGNFTVSWRKTSDNQTGICTVNRNNQVTYFGAERTSSNSYSPETPQETMAQFRSGIYQVRVFRQGNQSFATIFNTDAQNFELENTAVEQITVDRVDIYLARVNNRDFQIRVNPDNSYRLIINEGTRQIYP